MRRWVAAALLAAALVAGCGGGGEDPPQTKAGFIADADGVCETVATRYVDAGSTNPTTPEEIKLANDVLVDLYLELSTKLREVRLPAAAADRAGAQEFVDSVAATAPLLARLKSSSRALVLAAGGSDPLRLAQAGNDVRKALDGFRAQTAASDNLARAYGLSVCGNIG